MWRAKHHQKPVMHNWLICPLLLTNIPKNGHYFHVLIHISSLVECNLLKLDACESRQPGHVHLKKWDNCVNFVAKILVVYLSVEILLYRLAERNETKHESLLQCIEVFCLVSFRSARRYNSTDRYTTKILATKTTQEWSMDHMCHRSLWRRALHWNLHWGNLELPNKCSA